MKHRHHTQKKAKGGSIREAEMSEAKSKGDGFKRGGSKKLKAGGLASGGKAHMRLDRGSRKHRAAGGSALSTAAKTTDRKDSAEGAGHESVKVGKGEPSEEEPDRAGLACGGTAKRKDGGKWIQGAIKHKGALHRELGVPEGQKIPAKKLEKATHSDNPKLARRARLAEALKHMH